MNGGLIALIVVGVVILLILMIVIGMYNSFVVKNNNVDNAFAAIDTQLKKRCDLIPNLVSTAKAYMKHESGTLQAIAELRSQAMNPNASPEERIQLNNQMTKAIRGFMVQVEAYPDLKASENFIHLQRTLNEVEEQLSAARRAYNAAVTDMNNAIMMFPGSMFAGMFKFSKRTLFEVTSEERSNPNVENLFK